MDVGVLEKIIEKIKESDSICVLVHVNPDGDALGSGLTMYLALKQLNKNVDLIVPSYPRIYNFLPSIDEIKENSDIDSYDLCICLDCASRERVYEPKSIFDNAKTTVVIDHHTSNTNYADYNLVMGEEPACSQALVYILEKLNVTLTKEIGHCIAAGIITDTGGFKNTNVNSFTFILASRLMDLGIDVSEVIRELLESKNRAQFELIKLVTNRLEFYNNGEIAFSYITNDDMVNAGAELGDHEGLVDIGKSIKDVLVSIFVREEKDGFTVSFRAKNGINVRVIAEYFGGGGHTAAAGCFIKDNLENVKKVLVKKVKESLNG